MCSGVQDQSFVPFVGKLQITYINIRKAIQILEMSQKGKLCFVLKEQLILKGSLNICSSSFLNRNFRCDCGNSKFKNLECKLFPVSIHCDYKYTWDQGERWLSGLEHDCSFKDPVQFPASTTTCNSSSKGSTRLSGLC